MTDAWIETFSGRRFDILAPRPEDVFIEDIAHALALQCRFTGHVKFHYSIAQHSWFASQLVPSTDALWALLHDASEAYISDLSRPLKHFTDAGRAYQEIEKPIQDAICSRFGLPLTAPKSVHKADNELLYAERNQLMVPIEWSTKWSADEKAANITIFEITPRKAEAYFLDRFYRLFTPSYKI